MGDAKLTVHPLTPERWPDLEAIFLAKGCSVARGCWCMYYRVSGTRPAPPKGTTRSAAHRAALKALVDAGEPVGLLGYRGRTPVGWVSIAPRESYAKLEAYPVDRPQRASDDAMWFGAKSMFDAAGFEEVARRKPQRPVVRLRTSARGPVTGG